MTLAHSFKDKADRLEDVNGGLFTYPMLMAADILLYDATIVPVGKDQLQHIEMTRDVANRFNAKMGQTFVIPDERLATENMLIPGTDGQKMSKSRNNYLDIFADEKTLKKQVMSILSDSTPIEEPKNPDTCAIFALYKTVASAEQILWMREAYLKGGFGFGHAKSALLEVLLDRFSKERQLFNYYLEHDNELEDILISGAKKARLTANEVLTRVRTRLGY